MLREDSTKKCKLFLASYSIKEKQLRELIEQKKPINAIAAVMKKSRQSIKQKMDRLNLEEVGRGIQNPSSSRINVPGDLQCVNIDIKKKQMKTEVVEQTVSEK